MLTSYAQNFEDVILWRALKHVERGCYVDIGAWDPVIDSVSLAFYEQGWRGLHVEPEPAAAARLRQARRDEDVLEAAVGEGGEIRFHAIPYTGLSTSDQAMAERHAANGHAVQTLSVPVVRLSEVLDRFRGREVHWLKIDVEGMEGPVLAGWQPSPVRPWIVVVEVVAPYPTDADASAWEPGLLALGYEFAYFDGLNRFYLSSAHPELRRHFGPGPNVFDNFALAGGSSPFCSRLLQAHAEAEQRAAGQAEAARSREQALVRQLDDFRGAMTALERANAAMAKSLAWSRNELRASLRRMRRQEDHSRWLEANRAELTAAIGRMEIDAANLRSRTDALWKVADEALRELASLHASRSWRLTAPLRWGVLKGRACAAFLMRPRTLLEGGPARLLSAIVGGAAHLLATRPRLRRVVLLALDLVPGLKTLARRANDAWRRRAVIAGADADRQPDGARESVARPVSASARRIHRRLERACAIHSTP
ncbi:MAG TPA: FkbM family methyltransferase [Hyphomicrobiaceae bacterium]|nr:FkbM family methyltransferase [Hyphomicrobiaceae bacterium]